MFNGIILEFSLKPVGRILGADKANRRGDIICKP